MKPAGSSKQVRRDERKNARRFGDVVVVRSLVRICVGALLMLASASCADPYWVCDSPKETREGALPRRLSQTGLYADQDARVLANSVRHFRPEFVLWADGAHKERYVLLPAGSKVDTNDPDAWQFPEGTKFWKEFSVGDRPLETRLLQKLGPNPEDWAAIAYVWDVDGRDATAAPYGAEDVLGTSHDVPGSGECFACHGGRASRALGFSAVQLAHAMEPGDLNLAELIAAGRLTKPPTTDINVPGNETERAALGYLHANCAHCHNKARPKQSGHRCFDPQNRLDFWLRTDRLASVSETATYQTAIGSGIEPGHPGKSRMIDLVSSRGMFQQMPPLGTDQVDTQGLATLKRWIGAMR